MLAVLYLTVSLNSNGQDATTKIDQNDLRAFIRTLSSIQFEGRSVDNKGQIKTQEFITDRYKTLKLEPYSSGGYLEKFFLNLSDKGGVYLKTPNGQTLRNLDRMVFTGDIPTINVIESQIVFGGYGSENELNQIEVENRIVLILTESSSGDYAIKKRLEERKAIGLIYFSNDERPFESTKNLFKNVHYRKSYAISDSRENMTSQQEEIPFLYFMMIPGAETINVIGLSKSKLINLADRKRIKKAPVAKISVHFEQAQKKIETANVLGVIKGESEQSIILSAHYDHMGVEENRYYPGADDNASGIAALLELAEEFKQYGDLKYTMIFLATSSEEGGLLGSSYHVNHPDFEPDKVVCNINMDMISRCDGKQTDCRYLYCIGNNLSETLDSLVREADNLFPLCSCDYSENISDIFVRTDTYNFSKKGIPAILFFAGFHDDYHKPTDTIEKIDFDILENRVLLISDIIKLIQRTPNPIRKPVSTINPE